MYGEQSSNCDEVNTLSNEYTMAKDMMIEVVPEMMKSIMMAPYTEETAKQLASTLVAFYNELRSKGLKEQFAERLTEVYLGAFRQFLNLPQGK
jgi:hypothetical protein